MKHLFEKFLSISIFSFIFSQGIDTVTGKDIPTLSPEESLAVQDMSSKIDPMKKTIEELLGANLRADSKNPDQFKPKTSIELKGAKFGTNRLIISMSKWGQITITIQPHNVDKNEPWTEECQIKLYVGFNGCLKTGKTLMFKGSATCVTLENEKEQSILFFLPGDICKRYDLNRTPDYWAVRCTTDGIGQDIIIINKDGKNAYQPNPEDFHIKAKECSDIQPFILRNADQLPPYADIKVKDHPTLFLNLDA